MNWRATTRRLLPYLIVAGAGFLLAYLVVFAFVFPSSMVPAVDGNVPGVVGVDYTDASRRLGVAGYTPARGMRRYSARVPEGTVLAQSPAAGTSLPRGAVVTLDVSAGEQSAEIPPVIGASEQQARSLLETAGFTIGTVTQQPSTSVGRGDVARTDPAPGTTVRVPSSVNLVVSSGVPRVRVPDLAGRPLDDARRLLAEAGLELGAVAVDPTAVDLPNTVVGQALAPATSVDMGSRVNVTVAGVSSQPAP